MEPEQALTYVIGALILLLVVFRVIYTRSRKQRLRRMQGFDRPKPETTLFGEDGEDRFGDSDQTGSDSD